MTIHDINVLVGAIKAEGITLAATPDGKLHVEIPPAAVPDLRDTLRATLAARKGEIIAVLTGTPQPAGDGMVYDPRGGVRLAEPPHFSPVEWHALATLELLNDPIYERGLWADFQQAIDWYTEGSGRVGAEWEALAELQAGVSRIVGYDCTAATKRLPVPIHLAPNQRTALCA